MNFTDIFIRRPVLASVVSLAILVGELPSYGSLHILQYPKTENGIVTINTVYPGADPDSIAGFITAPIEAAVAQANGIDYMTSTSDSGLSTITVNLRQNYDTSRAAAEINIKVNSVLNQLPTGSQQPAISVKVGQTTDALYFGFASPTLAPNEITDYLQRVVVPKLQAVRGVANPRDPRRPVLFAAPLARSEEAASLWADGQRCDGRAEQQRLHFGHRQHQGPDGASDAHPEHEPAFFERIPQSGGQADQRQQHPLERSGPGHPGRRQLRGARGLRRPQRRVRRHPDRAQRQSAVGHRRRQGRLPGDQVAAASRA